MHCPFDQDCEAWCNFSQRCFYYALFEAKSKKVKKGVCPRKEKENAANEQVRPTSPSGSLAL
jgi:hypothetical protein